MRKIHLISAAMIALSPMAFAAQGLNDAQIAAIVVRANQVDIDAGKLAQAKTSNKDVKAFAQRMVADHGAVNQSARALVARLGVTPEPSATSNSLQKDADATLVRLERLQGAAFDKAYVDNEVAYHGNVLDALDRTLIPGATNQELKALLVQVRPAFVTHLEHARHIQSALRD
jgi:putative membrane protein